MDKETLNEYGHIVIATIISVLLLAAITSSLFLGKVRSLADASTPEHDRYEYDNNAAYEQYIAEKNNQ